MDNLMKGNERPRFEPIDFIPLYGINTNLQKNVFADWSRGIDELSRVGYGIYQICSTAAILAISIKGLQNILN